MTKIKICGVCSAENALLAARAGADLIGLNFYRGSPRYIAPSAAAEIARALRAELGAACPMLVGVFVNASAAQVRAIVSEVGLDFAQLSGDEPLATAAALPGIAFKSIRPRAEADALAAAAHFAPTYPLDEKAPSLLVDAFNPKLYGGTGETASLSVALALKAAVPRLMLAGGLKPGNVGARVQAVRPWGVDVASGVEAGQPGYKDESKLRAFIQAVRAAEK